MLIKVWAFALVLALAVAPVVSSLAADVPAGAGTNPQGNNAAAGTAAAGTSTPSGKSDTEDANAKKAASGSRATVKSNDASK
jgi:hypothetical protein